MKSFGRREAAVIAVMLAPVVASLATLFLATLGPLRSIPPGPLEGGGWTARSRGWLEFSGFYPAELEADRSFSWMSGSGRIRLAPLNRSVAYRLSLWVQPAVAGRPVDLATTVDGLGMPPASLVPGPQRVDIDLPPRGSNRAIVTLTVSQTFVPGAADPRVLGMRVDAVALKPAEGHLKIPSESLYAAALAGLGLGVLLAVTMGAGWASLALGAASGAWFGFLLAYDASFLGPFPGRIQVIGLSVGVLGLAVASFRRLPEPWSFVSAIGAATVLGACKLALFFHPMATVGDSVFHVHRAQVVQRGEYFFTSITPRPFFEFPYPPGLYVAVAPIWRMLHGDIEHVWLLRTAVIIAEILLGLAIYGVVFANWRNRLIAFLASTLCLLVPVGLYTVCTSNLTNSFGQSVFGMGVAALLCAHLRRGWIAASVGTALLFAGFLSHFSTFSVGVPLLSVTVLLLFCARTGPARRTAVAVAVGLAVATTASVAVYYAHFMPVYQRTADRVVAREGEAQARSMVAPIKVKAQRAAATVGDEFGLAILVATVAGAAQLIRARDPLSIALMAWAATVIGFWVLGIFTAIEMRASLAAQPVAAILAAAAVAMAARRRPWARACAVAILLVIVLHAVSDWCMCLGLDGVWKI